MDWLVIDEDYLNYLRNVEPRIPRSDYGKDKYREGDEYANIN